MKFACPWHILSFQTRHRRVPLSCAVAKQHKGAISKVAMLPSVLQLAAVPVPFHKFDNLRAAEEMRAVARERLAAGMERVNRNLAKVHRPSGAPGGTSA
jgi:hypothetical protein